MSRLLTLIAPRIAPALTQAIADGSARWPQLARLAGRGSIERLAPAPAASGLRPWQVSLLTALNLDTHYPSAAVTRTGDSNERTSGFWLHVEPIHFAAGLDRLTALVLQGERRVSEAERAELESLVAAHLRASGFDLVTTSAGDWLLRCPRALDVQTMSPEVATSSPLEEVMPRGKDARELRRLMTELQMLLHEHPVNVHRSRRGVPEVNAIWFHGEGEIGGVRRQSLPQAFGEDAYLRGVYRLHDFSVEPAAADARSLLSRAAKHSVAVIDIEDLDTLEALWLAPLARALLVGAIGRVDLVLDRWHLAISCAALLKFWRSERPPARWAA